MIYQIPKEYFFRLHHIRPRFKNDIENVLIFMATEISGIPELPKKLFAVEVNNSIKKFSGNVFKTQKTVDNWRTEISSLFGFIEHNSLNNTDKPSELVQKLSEDQDLPEFFKYFLFHFQYPGGHLKPTEILKMIKLGIRFKPARYILKLLKTAEKHTGKKFKINKAEATHCIFNDLRVTRDGMDVKVVIKQILKNRKLKIKYTVKGDVVRYAKDILDYMVIANLLEYRTGYYCINDKENTAIDEFIKNGNFFYNYKILYKKEDVNINDVKNTQDSWIKFVNTKLDSHIFKTNISNFINIDESNYKTLAVKALENFKNSETDITVNTKEIGNLGENLALGHECMRMKNCEKLNLIHLVKKIPDHLGIGYDIQSFEIDETKRFIEVKTTISSSEITFFNFHLTTNEWITAETLRSSYYIYRLIINKENTKLFIIQDPVGKYKKDELNMIPRNGADITCNNNSGKWEVLLIWEG